MKRCWLPVVPVLAALTGLSAATSEDLSVVLRLPSDSAALRTLAISWQERSEELLRRLTDTDPAQRRSAARLLGHMAQPPAIAVLWAALRATGDEDCFRLCLPAIERQLAELPPAEVLHAATPALACHLLVQHPTAMIDAAVRQQLQTWLATPATAVAAGEVIIARGEVATWGNALIKNLQSADPLVVATAHRCLEVLTRTQRRLDLYAGHSDLLATDWQDVLSRSGQTGTAPDAAIITQIEALPNESALLALLPYGRRALPAMDAALTTADAARRRELQPVARLLARDVSTTLWLELGSSGLENIDAEDSRARVESLEHIAATVLAHKDAPGLRCVFSFASDRDGRVRTACYNRLLRLSDAGKEFGNVFHLDAAGTLWPESVLPALRHSLREGGADEQISAIQVAGMLKAAALQDAVGALTLSPHAAVVDTAMDTMVRLNADSVALFSRIARDPSQPLARRVRAIGQMVEKAEDVRYSDTAGLPYTAVAKELAASTTDNPTLNRLARRLQILSSSTADERLKLLRQELSGEDEDRLTAVRLIGEVFVSKDEYRILFAPLVVPLLFDAVPTIAEAASTCLLKAQGEADGEAEQKKWGTFFDEPTRTRLNAMASQDENVNASLLALAFYLDLLDRPTLVRHAGTRREHEAELLWRAVIDRSPSMLPVLVELAETGADKRPDDVPAYYLLNKIGTDVAMTPAVFPLVLKYGVFGVLGSSGSSSSYGNGGKLTKSFPLGAGGKLTVVGTRPVHSPGADTNPFMDDDDPNVVWAVQGTAPLLPEAESQALTKQLANLAVTQDYQEKLQLYRAMLGVGDLPEPTEHLVEQNRGWVNLASLAHPEWRPAVATVLNGMKAPSSWTLRSFLVAGNPDLLPAALASIASDTDEWSLRPFASWLISLSDDALRPHLAVLQSNPALLLIEGMQERLGTLGPVPVQAVIGMLIAGKSGITAVAPFGPEAIPELTKAFQTLGAHDIASRVSLLRLLRASGPEAFDAVLAKRLTIGGGIEAAWLRTGIPAAAGMAERYELAWTSPAPQLWLAGGAYKLREGTLAVADFLVRLKDLPRSFQADAVLIIERYAGNALTDQVEALTSIVRSCPSDVLPEWIALLPADPDIEAALLERIKATATARLLVIPLALRQVHGGAAWQALVQRLTAAAPAVLGVLSDGGGGAPRDDAGAGGLP